MIADTEERSYFSTCKDDHSTNPIGFQSRATKCTTCDMGTTEKAAYDPVFYLHNTFIDYLWAYWQKMGESLPYVFNSEADKPLPPFDRAESITIKGL